MPDLKAKLRAKFTRRQSSGTSVGAVTQDNSSVASSIADGQRTPLVSRSSTVASQTLQQQQEHPPPKQDETNHKISTPGYFDGLKSRAQLQHPPGATSHKPQSWNVGDVEDEEVDGDYKNRPGSITSTDSAATSTTKTTTTTAGLAASIEPATAASATATDSASIPAAKAQTNDMNGNDLPHLRPPISRLPSINEQPAIEASETDNAAEPAAHTANESSSATDDDDGFLPSTPFQYRDNDTVQTPRVVPATPDAAQTLRPPPSDSRPGGPPRRQSLLPNRQATLIRTLLHAAQADDIDISTAEQLLPIYNSMVTRKIWVRRAGSSPTQVTINEDDLVDDVRDMILRKYGNSLGRQFDSPDLTLRIVPREKRLERVLGPEEPMSRTLDAYFPGGQTVEEALVIDVPLVRRTPRASPRTGPPHATHLTSVGYYDEVRPTDSSTDYFGPNVVTAGHMPIAITAPSAGSSHPHSMAVISGQVPQIPSPGGTRSRTYRDRPDRPRLGRQHTSSPTILGGHPVGNLAGATATHGMHDQSAGAVVPPAPPMPTPPAGDIPNSVPSMVPMQRTSTPPPRTASPRPIAPQATGSSRPRRKKTAEQTPPALPTSILNNGVPPINVLIVEDNIINLKLLEAFVKRLKVRWQTAMNGREAVTKWRTGGFHLVLMDIQLPIMSGLDATREIRRLERVNSIGVFSGSAGSAFAPEGTSPGENGEKAEPKPEDKLVNMEVFKSPVIIVALTASSLQSDRHEALAAGCNDFLTKPVNFVWLERKVMEWGCMQALIDFDGWRKWKDFSHKADEAEASKKAAKTTKKSKSRQSTASLVSAQVQS